MKQQEYKSTNTSWEKKRRKKKESQFIKVIDNSNDASLKRVLIHVRNQANGFEEDTPLIWKDYIVSQNITHDFHPFKPIYLQISYPDQGIYFPTFQPTVGKKYYILNGEITQESAASPSTETHVHNNHDSYNMSVQVVRDHSVMDSKILTPGSIFKYKYRPNFWIQITDLESEGDPSDANTEISVLGVKSAHVIVTGGGAGPSAMPYSFTLTNIIYD